LRTASSQDRFPLEVKFKANLLRNIRLFAHVLVHKTGSHAGSVGTAFFAGHALAPARFFFSLIRRNARVVRCHPEPAIPLAEGCHVVTSQDCKKNARDCTKLAEAASTSRQRDLLFELARVWETMARHAARLEQRETADSRAA
jgi:hypothetical protein